MFSFSCRLCDVRNTGYVCFSKLLIYLSFPTNFVTAIVLNVGLFVLLVLVK
jgi:hypothetical protein